MSWKDDLQLLDLPPEKQIEVTCLRCGRGRYEIAADLMQEPRFCQMRLSEIERELRCAAKFCRSKVRIALNHGKTEGFTGGMA